MVSVGLDQRDTTKQQFKGDACERGKSGKIRWPNVLG